MARNGKFNAKRTRVDGYSFDSQVEAKRYGELKLMQIGRQIADLAVHPRFPLTVNGRPVTTYEADFSYLEPRPLPPAMMCDHGMSFRGGVTTVRVIEDVKGFATPEYKIKRELFLALHPDCEFRELNTDKSSERKAWSKFAAGRVQTQGTK